jgi:hypothetical protein
MEAIILNPPPLIHDQTIHAETTPCNCFISDFFNFLQLVSIQVQWSFFLFFSLENLLNELHDAGCRLLASAFYNSLNPLLKNHPIAIADNSNPPNRTNGWNP